MTDLMTPEQAQEWHKQLISIYPGRILKPEGFLRHNQLTGEIAREAVVALLDYHPRLSSRISKDEVYLAGALHDIADPVHEKSTFHELYGAQMIEQNVNVGPYDVRMKIAQMVRPHFVVSEEFADPAYDLSDEKKPFLNIDPQKLIPRTWQEQIVAWADLVNSKQKRVTYEERLADIRNRYENDPSYIKLNPDLARVMQTALPRLESLCKRVESLLVGKLDEKVIMEYGFL